MSGELFAINGGHMLGVGLDELTPEQRDPNYRWNGPDTTITKNEQVGIAARRNAFATIEDFAAWRKGKGYPVLSPAELQAAFARYRGEPIPEGPVNETAMLIHDRETAVIGAGHAGVHVGRRYY